MSGESQRYLLDTNICIYIAKGQPLAVRHRFEMHEVHTLAMSAITMGGAALWCTKEPVP